jgi:tetratricopeptide (TPR) repeat protein
MAKIDKETLDKIVKGQITVGQALNIDANQYAAILLAGHTLFNEGRLDEAKQLFEGLAGLDAKNPYIHGILGAIHQKQGNDEVAIARYTKALSIYGKDINSLTNRGELYLKHGKFQESANDLKRAIDLDPDKKHPAANRARLLVVMTAEALKLAQEKGMDAVWDAKKRIDAQLGSA